jgi:hypothetical protein
MATPSDFGTGLRTGSELSLEAQTVSAKYRPHRNPARHQPLLGFDHSIENQANWKAARARKSRAWRAVQGGGKIHKPQPQTN